MHPTPLLAANERRLAGLTAAGAGLRATPLGHLSFP
jgi:hypothetical protein